MKILWMGYHYILFIIIFVTNQEPNVSHICVIVLPPLYIHHLNAWQCNAGAKNGDIANPYIFDGTHK